MRNFVYFFSFFSLSLSLASENFSSYTLIEVLREEIVTAQEKKMWVMENILSLDDEELKKKGKSLKKRGKKLNKKDHDKMRRKTRLQEWADSL